ncbi:DUF6502 family protein [Azospirillum sp. sgz301742]
MPDDRLPAPDDTPGPPPAVLGAVRRVLRPLVRVLIHYGITFPTLATLLKGVYVDVAERDCALPGRPMTDSRVTLLTGVHRKDVSRLRDQPAPAQEAVAASPSLAAQVVARWLGDSAFRAPDGAPLPLPRAGAEPSFEALVAGISKDIRPRALLDELLRAELVRERDDGLLDLAASAHLPHGDLNKLAHYYGRNLADHAAAAGHNLMGGTPPFLERAMFHDGLSLRSIEELRTEAERLGMELLVHLNRRANELSAHDAFSAAPKQRFTAGLYTYSAPDDPTPEDKP